MPSASAAPERTSGSRSPSAVTSARPAAARSPPPSTPSTLAAVSRTTASGEASRRATSGGSRLGPEVAETEGGVDLCVGVAERQRSISASTLIPRGLCRHFLAFCVEMIFLICALSFARRALSSRICSAAQTVSPVAAAIMASTRPITPVSATLPLAVSIALTSFVRSVIWRTAVVTAAIAGPYSRIWRFGPLNAAPIDSTTAPTTTKGIADVVGDAEDRDVVREEDADRGPRGGGRAHQLSAAPAS